MKDVGAHAKASGFNHRSIGVAFNGNFDTSKPSEEMLQVGIDLVTSLALSFGIRQDRVIGHKDVPGAQTVCPGQHFPIERFQKAVSDLYRIVARP